MNQELPQAGTHFCMTLGPGQTTVELMCMHYQKQQELSLSTWQLIVREFSAGTTSLTDVIQVERQLLDYRLKKSEAIAEYNTRIAGIEKLVATSINE